MNDAASFEAALGRWAIALYWRGEWGTAAAAVADDAVVVRFAPDGSEPVERFAGATEIAAWLARGPWYMLFGVVPGTLVITDDAATLRYCVAIGGFSNYGSWRVRLAADGRLELVEHRPDALLPDAQAGPADD